MDRTKVTLSDVAADAGVSLATVSRVINQTGPVKEDTRQKVLDAIEKLGYQCGEPARSVPQSRKLLLFSLPILSNPFYVEIVRGAKLSAAQHGFRILFTEGHVTAPELSELLLTVKQIKAAGMIIANQISTPLLRTLAQAIPVVQCCEFNEDFKLPFVSVDDVQAAIQAVEHLIFTGKHRIALLNGPMRYKYAQNRLRGYQLALARHGLTFNPRLVVSLPDIEYTIAVSATMQLLSSPSPPDAIFCCSDVFAMAAIRAAKLSGLKVPENLAIVGFDNADVTAVTVPSITTVNQPRFQMGFSACEMLIEQLENPDVPIRELFMDTELIVRESTRQLN